MTTQTREPSRTPADAQSTGSQQTLDLADLALQVVARLCAAGAIGLACAISHTRGWDPGISLLAMFLLWHYVGPNGVRAAWGGAK